MGIMHYIIIGVLFCCLCIKSSRFSSGSWEQMLHNERCGCALEGASRRMWTTEAGFKADGRNTVELATSRPRLTTLLSPLSPSVLLWQRLIYICSNCFQLPVYMCFMWRALRTRTGYIRHSEYSIQSNFWLDDTA